MNNFNPQKPRYFKILGWIFLCLAFILYFGSFFVVYAADYGENIVFIKHAKRSISDSAFALYGELRILSGVSLLVGLFLILIYFYQFYIIYTNKINSNARDR